jgi:hypothetical protein
MTAVIGCDAVVVFFGLVNFLQAIRAGTSSSFFLVGSAVTVSDLDYKE